MTQINNQRNSNDFNNCFDNNADNNDYRSYQGQYNDYRSNDNIMKTNVNVMRARSFYQIISSSRNQFFIFYQCRSNQYSSYQNCVYISQTQSQRSQFYDETFQNFDEILLQDYFNKNLDQNFYQANQFVQSLLNQRFKNAFLSINSNAYVDQRSSFRFFNNFNNQT